MSNYIIYAIIVLVFNLFWLINHGPRAFAELYKLWYSKAYPWELSAVVWAYTLSGIAFFLIDLIPKI